VNWHSQFGEDKWLHENGHFNDIGTFCEVGAYDGLSSSNTLAFEQMGWTGVCVEPEPDLARQCAANRRAMVIPCAIGMGPTVQTFRINPAGKGGSSLSGPDSWQWFLVPVCRLDAIFRLTGVPELLSIDTEGTELDVWATVENGRPRIVIMEFWTQPNPPNPEPLVARMIADGYREAHRTEANLIFVRI
jgi:FkbM family methyltransferase